MRRARRDAGFSMAALIVFLTAMSILLTIGLPNLVMQAQREREKELIFRGEEYARAISKFQRTLNLLPSSVDELLSSNGTRFLRKAYADPVSGEMWRPIYLNQDGTLTGSNVYQSLGQVPTTTSVRATPQQQPQTQNQNNPGPQTNNSLGTPSSNLSSFSQSPTNNNQNRPPTNGPVQPTNPQPQQQQQQQQQQATPLTGLVGVGSGSKGTGVMVYNKQEQYSNWEFIAQLQQRNNNQANNNNNNQNNNNQNNQNNNNRQPTINNNSNNNQNRPPQTGR